MEQRRPTYRPWIVCPKCKYEWRPRVVNPKRCPRCGKWLVAPGAVAPEEVAAGT